MKKLLIILLVIVLISVAGRQMEILLDSRLDANAGPWLQHGEQSNMRVYWHTAEATVSAASVYARDSQQAIQTIQLDDDRRSHSVTFDGLQPGSDYEYAVHLPDQKNPTRHPFRTAPATQDSSIRLWVLGDPGIDGEIARSVHAAAGQWMSDHALLQPREVSGGRPDLILTTGDNAYTSGRFDEYLDALLLPLASELAQTSFWPAYGNHDSRRRAFFKLFTFPANGDSGGVASDSQRYYSFDYGPLHVIMLDSESSLRLGKTGMLEWLQRDLQHNTLPWTIAVLHHPPYSNGSNDSDAASGSDWRQRAVREEIVPELEQAGVDLVLAGHSHSYERSHLINGHYATSDTLTDAMLYQRGSGPGDVYMTNSDCQSHCGTVYVVIGSSSKVDQAPLEHPVMAVSTASAGSLVMDVNRHCLRTRMIDQHGSSVDAFTLQNAEYAGDCQIGQ